MASLMSREPRGNVRGSSAAVHAADIDRVAVLGWRKPNEPTSTLVPGGWPAEEVDRIDPIGGDSSDAFDNLLAGYKKPRTGD